MVEDSTYELERQLLTKYRQELATARQDYADAAARIERYELGIRGLAAVIAERQNGEGAESGAQQRGEPVEDSAGAAVEQEPEAEQTGPRGADAVRRILTEHPHRPFSPKELADALQERGWITPGTKHPVESTRAAANRLRYKEDEPFVYENGKYIYVPPNNGASYSGLNLLVPGPSEA
jgi:hypothetical protein